MNKGKLVFLYIYKICLHLDSGKEVYSWHWHYGRYRWKPASVESIDFFWQFVWLTFTVSMWTAGKIAQWLSLLPCRSTVCQETGTYSLCKGAVGITGLVSQISAKFQLWNGLNVHQDADCFVCVKIVFFSWWKITLNKQKLGSFDKKF